MGIKYSGNTLEKLKYLSTITLLIFIILECFFFPSWENAFGCFALLYGWLLISKTALKEKYLREFFLPFVTLLGYSYSFFFLPIVVTFIEGKPLTFRFNVPFLTFFNLMLNATTIVLAFHICRCIYNKNGWLTRLWKRLGYFTPPSSRQIWVLGIIGYIALLWNANRQGTDLMEAQNLGALGQFILAIKDFAYVPILFFFAKYWGNGSKILVKPKWIYLYFVPLIFISIATTRRGLLFNTVFIWGVMTFLTILLENRQILTRKSCFIFFLGFYMLSGPVTDMATAMIIHRQDMRSQNAMKTLSDVFDTYSDKEKLRTLARLGTFSNSDNAGDNFFAWSEYYVDNIIFDRFCNLRTQDITLDYAEKLGYGTRRMKEYAMNFIIFQVPTPILSAIGYKGDKFENNYTPGDLLSTDALALNRQYRGFRVAGDSGIGLSLMGYWYYPFALLIYIAVFYFFSSLVLSNKGFMVIPIPVILGMLLYVTYFNNATGIFRSINLLLRSGWQDIIIYCLIMYIIRKIIK